MAARGLETVVIDATCIRYIKRAYDRYDKPVPLASFFHPNGQRFQAPLLSPCTLRCVCEADGTVLQVRKAKDDQTRMAKFRLIDRHAKPAGDEEGERAGTDAAKKGKQKAKPKAAPKGIEASSPKRVSGAPDPAPAAGRPRTGTQAGSERRDPPDAVELR
jgi:hypothetical protein